MYPRQFIRLCGDYPHFYGDFDPKKMESIALHRFYFWITGILGRRFRLKGAYLSDETNGSYVDAGQFKLLTETAEFLNL